MPDAARSPQKISGMRSDGPAIDFKNVVAFYDEKGFVLTMMQMQRRASVGWDDVFHDGECTVGVFLRSLQIHQIAENVEWLTVAAFPLRD